MACALFADDPPCSAATCPEMRASEWQYLCAAHEPPKSCCAIDYCCHTLDWCATALTSTKLFPSRLGLGTETLSAQAQIRKMTEVFRRVYRIFAHAWFSHRDVFWRVESKTGLYLLFKTRRQLHHSSRGRRHRDHPCRYSRCAHHLAEGIARSRARWKFYACFR
jgi:hypothetical protein